MLYGGGGGLWCVVSYFCPSQNNSLLQMFIPVPSQSIFIFFPFHPLFLLLFVTLDGVVCTNNQWGGAVRSLQVWFSVMLDSVL